MTAALPPEQLRQLYPQFSEPELQEELLALGRQHDFREGEVIMDYGSHVRMLPLILSGTIKISRRAEDGSELFLYYLGPGESCTMTFTCCMSDKVSEIRAVAEEDTSLLGLPRQKLDEWMRYRSWKNFVMQSYDTRMRELIQTIDQVAFSQLDARLLHYLEQRTAALGTRELTTTHQAIAADLNVSREAVSRLLKLLERQDKVSLGRNRVTLIPGV